MSEIIDKEGAIERPIVRFTEIIESAAYRDTDAPLPMALGKDPGGQPVVADLAGMPHLLVAGAGKSAGLRAMILSLLHKSGPDKLRLLLIDSGKRELSIYEGIPHLLAPVMNDVKQAANALHWCLGEMERRHRLLSETGVRNIAALARSIEEAEKTGAKPAGPLAPPPYIVVVIAEFADLMRSAGREFEQIIARLAQKSRAAGIHVILATRRPSAEVVTGLIKANVLARISFRLSSGIDSRVILDEAGAEALPGRDDLLYRLPGARLMRVHGVVVADEEIRRAVDHLGNAGAPEYADGILAPFGDRQEGSEAEPDPLYDQTVDIVQKSRRISIPLVQRRLRIGYDRAARLLDAMEKARVASAMDERGEREALGRKAEE